MSGIDHLAKKLAPHYSRFNVANRLLFTGHSHQAWPDVAREGQTEYFDVCARDVDNKWGAAFEKTEILRNYLRDFYDDPDGFYCREESTHVLFVSWMSSLNLKNKPKIISTDGEFHSLFRQLHRLEEEGLEFVQVPVQPDDTFAERIIEEMDDRTSAVMLSRVYFETSLINTHLTEIAAAARKNGIPVLIDDYHGTNVVPLSIREAGLEDCFILIGGYKYLQWGEANCFLRFPRDCDYRPAITGWFASFSTLDKPRTNEPVEYDHDNQRFASGTYDPSSQFRAAKVVEFFREMGLTPEVLREQYKAQVSLLRDTFKSKNFDPALIRLTHEKPLDLNGGFLSLTSPKAREIRAALMENEVFTDARGEILRFGPAPYITTDQIQKAMDKLEEVINSN
ncbi:aminotransferase class V-fold PLP-dependent enzyme [Gracilimonas amylolytica]|uniref:aminotransferase class V-fold PLP-dependent enzyme n=1 Tax=Gracilimonas amylolytica TaxID=1749045 RepID=UPI000CD9370B|nr:aminotransferase class V-fold PLP-dependent enzyme [Gracilimonas amylolytica]